MLNAISLACLFLSQFKFSGISGAEYNFEVTVNNVQYKGTASLVGEIGKQQLFTLEDFVVKSCMPPDSPVDAFQFIIQDSGENLQDFMISDVSTANKLYPIQALQKVSSTPLKLKISFPLQCGNFEKVDVTVGIMLDVKKNPREVSANATVLLSSSQKDKIIVSPLVGWTCNLIILSIILSVDASRDEIFAKDPNALFFLETGVEGKFKRSWMLNSEKIQGHGTAFTAKITKNQVYLGIRISLDGTMVRTFIMATFDEWNRKITIKDGAECIKIKGTNAAKPIKTEKLYQFVRGHILKRSTFGLVRNMETYSAESWVGINIDSTIDLDSIRKAQSFRTEIPYTY